MDAATPTISTICGVPAPAWRQGATSSLRAAEMMKSRPGHERRSTSRGETGGPSPGPDGAGSRPRRAAGNGLSEDRELPMRVRGE
jgi:hypothetical protein